MIEPPSWPEVAGAELCNETVALPTTDITDLMARCTLPPRHVGAHGAAAMGWREDGSPVRLTLSWPKWGE